MSSIWLNIKDEATQADANQAMWTGTGPEVIICPHKEWYGIHNQCPKIVFWSYITHLYTTV